MCVHVCVFACMSGAVPVQYQRPYTCNHKVIREHLSPDFYMTCSENLEIMTVTRYTEFT